MVAIVDDADRLRRFSRTSGYDEVAPYDDDPHAHHWFHMDLPGPAPEPPS